jgi:hypothetical protein
MTVQLVLYRFASPLAPSETRTGASARKQETPVLFTFYPVETLLKHDVAHLGIRVITLAIRHLTFEGIHADAGGGEGRVAG